MQKQKNGAKITVDDAYVVHGFEDGRPSVNFLPKILQKMDQNMSYSVFVRPLGWSISPGALYRSLIWLWKPKGDIKLVDMVDECFLVVFSREEDHSRALLRGLWSINGQYLTVHPYSRDFSTKNDNMITWIRIPELPIAYFHDDILRNIVKSLGRYIKADDATLAAERGKYARVAVEVNLSSALIDKVKVDGKWFKFEYEDLPKNFFSCCKYGHQSEDCAASPVPPAPPLSAPTDSLSEPKRQSPMEETTTNPVSETIEETTVICQQKGIAPWIKVEDLKPATTGHTLTVKVVESNVVLQKGRAVSPNLRNTRIAECLVGDETAAILFCARNDQVDLMIEGKTVILRNAKIDMFKGFMRLAVDKWGRIEITESAAFEVNKDNNLSLVEYVQVNDPDED